MTGIRDLHWSSDFISKTPGDNIEENYPRKVFNACWSKTTPSIVPSPEMIIWSDEMASILKIDEKESKILSGNVLCSGMKPYSQCYGGHQFGSWAGQLGDGRAITLGEVMSESGKLELQLKGSGTTPYSRFADGKAVLRSSIREFLCSEAMHHLGIPTTRALSLCITGEKILRDILYDGNPSYEPGAVICRVAPSFIRFGSFQIHALRGDMNSLKKLVNYTIKTHFGHLKSSGDQLLIDWLREVVESTARMVIHWMRVGFVHGVMNTDNMSIHGITIDYGPYGWIENYDHNWTPNITDLSTSRYRFGQQPNIAGWNLARLLESISPLFSETDKIHNLMLHYDDYLALEYQKMWCQKLGILKFDSKLINDLIFLLQEKEVDMTIFFRKLANIDESNHDSISESFYEEGISQEWINWLNSYLQKVTPERDVKMNTTNPKYILRNWMVQLAIEKAEEKDYSLLNELFQLIKMPYDEQLNYESKWFSKRPKWAKNKTGCSMLSCSS
ncbi:MAG: hypothetical protein ACI9EM_000890 [Candidatus Thalassarchaeaceae archaeon]|jgi:uncharacterized protein YdiU (UPF0061 family)|tara:strand:- start:438 stop:1943 length:1506 start_codon:yes stop_codon:yes gene_type:complete